MELSLGLDKSLFTLSFVLVVLAKIYGLIEWSWGFVLIPIWIFGGFVFLCSLIGVFCDTIFKDKKNERKLP